MYFRVLAHSHKSSVTIVKLLQCVRFCLSCFRGHSEDPQHSAGYQQLLWAVVTGMPCEKLTLSVTLVYRTLLGIFRSSWAKRTSCFFIKESDANAVQLMVTSWRRRNLWFLGCYQVTAGVPNPPCHPFSSGWMVCDSFTMNLDRIHFFFTVLFYKGNYLEILFFRFLRVNYDGNYEMFLRGRVFPNLGELLLYAQHSHQTDFVVDTLLGAEVTTISKMESLCYCIFLYKSVSY